MLRVLCRNRGRIPMRVQLVTSLTVSSSKWYSTREEIYEKVNEMPRIHPLLLERAEIISQEHKALSDTLSNSNEFNQELSTKFSNLSFAIEIYSRYKEQLTTLDELLEMVEEPNQDPEIISEAFDEIDTLLPELGQTIRKLQNRLPPPLKFGDKPTIIELRPGVGGGEAGLFTEDLMQMYINYANIKRWRWELVSKNEGSNGFPNEIIININEPGSYNELRFESGVHRVQRIPATEKQGRIHTSTAAVVVLPKMSEGNEKSLKEDERQFQPGEIRIDTMRSGGKGGQHVNTTDSAVRLVHIPTGIIVVQQDERSQPMNKAKAFSILRARLAQLEKDKEYADQRKMRTDQVSTTDRSDKIRTYNYPQNRVTDHRCGYSIHDLQGCMNGSKLGELIEKLEEYEFESRLQDLIYNSNSQQPQK
ncbi:uncharacterized protein RJT21DRAFT_119789 [Scheffersomyces amazonensis]|uniref:uncharacterized protein n=1 Tax=Scheffersomyces amazonensis TaxID=1078765 RepID=UPI00315DB8A8